MINNNLKVVNTESTMSAANMMLVHDLYLYHI